MSGDEVDIVYAHVDAPQAYYVIQNNVPVIVESNVQVSWDYQQFFRR